MLGSFREKKNLSRKVFRKKFFVYLFFTFYSLKNVFQLWTTNIPIPKSCLYLAIVRPAPIEILWSWVFPSLGMSSCILRSLSWDLLILSGFVLQQIMKKARKIRNESNLYHLRQKNHIHFMSVYRDFKSFLSTNNVVKQIRSLVK